MQEKEIRNFYEEEAEYEKSILLTKELVNKVVFLDTQEFIEKLKKVDNENNYSEFIDLYLAVTGRKTNKYYYCLNKEEIKYYQLEEGKVYKREEISLDLQSKYSEEKVLDLRARCILAQKLLGMIDSLKKIFSDNIKKGDGFVATIETLMITEKDIQFFDDFSKYLQLLIDKTGRLKILVAERDIYAIENAKQEYEKKSGVEKLFHKIFKTKKSTIDDIAKKMK